MKKCLLAFLFTLTLFGQKHVINGKISDNVTGDKLGFSTIRIAGKSFGTSANIDGNYEIRLAEGKYKLIASCLGFSSDTVSVILTNKNITIDFNLKPIIIHLPGVTITPGMNPANAIILKAIAQKNLRNKLISSYIYTASSKSVIRAPEEFKIGDEKADVSLGYSDTSKMKIGAIFENQSLGYFALPNRYKEEIIARKQTANLPSTINTLTGGRVIQNFYSDDIKFFNLKMTGPLAENALDFYYFDLIDSMVIDKKIIYHIYMSPADTLVSGFKGSIYIEGDSYNLQEVNLKLNRDASMGGLFNDISISQRFLPFGEQEIFMPVDYMLSVEIKYFKLFKMNFEIHSILYEYNINPNPPIDDNFFNKAIITVKTDADKKDSTYWASTQNVVSSKEEKEAYTEIDSIKQANINKKKKFSFFSDTYEINDSLNISGPIGIYRFNRIEGHTAQFNISTTNILNERLKSSAEFAYGFSDKRWKGQLNTKLLLGDYRTTKLSMKVFRSIRKTFHSDRDFSSILESVLNLASKYDGEMFCYSDGVSADYEAEVFPVVFFNAGYRLSHDKSASTSVNKPLFFPKSTYNSNDPIQDGRFSFINAGLTFDFRDYIEDGKYRRRFGAQNGAPIITLSALLSGKKLLYSTYNFTIYTASFNGNLNTMNNNVLSYNLVGNYAVGEVPYQYLIPVPGGYDGVFEDRSFRTLRMNKFLGDRSIYLNLSYDMQQSLWQMLKLKFLQKAGVNFSLFANTMISEMSNPSQQIALKSVNEFKHPYYEAGFGLIHPMIPLKLELGWRLNYVDKDKGSFVIGINTPMI